MCFLFAVFPFFPLLFFSFPGSPSHFLLSFFHLLYHDREWQEHSGGGRLAVAVAAAVDVVTAVVLVAVAVVSAVAAMAAVVHYGSKQPGFPA